MSQLYVDILAKRRSHDGRGKKVEIFLNVSQVHIEKDFVKLKVYGDNHDRLSPYISDDAWQNKLTDYSGTITIPASTVMRLAAQLFEQLAQRDDSSRMKEALVPVAVTALRDVLGATLRVLR